MYKYSDYSTDVITHQQYYGQFVDDKIINRVTRVIGLDNIIDSTDYYLNDISLDKWDSLSLQDYCSDKLRQTGSYPNLSAGVCIAKAAARIIKADYYANNIDQLSDKLE